MRLRDAALLLVGNRRAILALWRDRWALVVGALLVLSASLARNYDGHDLVREWTVFTHGFAASIVNAFLMYGMMYAVAMRKETPERGRFWSGYLSFLGVFWMTAPMAWLYGIPWEYMLAPEAAVTANMWTLALVSVWRVALTIRVLAIAFDTPVWKPAPVILFVSSAIAATALLLSPRPVIDFMGGLRHPPEFEALTQAHFAAMVYSVLLLPVTLLILLITFRWIRAGQSAMDRALRKPAPVPVFAVCAAAIAGWIGAAVWAQPPVQRKLDVERAVAERRYGDAAAVLLSYDESQFPPVWDLPPRRDSMDPRGVRVSVFATIDAVEARGPVPEWIAYRYGRKLLYTVDSEVQDTGELWREPESYRDWVLQGMSLDELDRTLALLGPVRSRLSERERRGVNALAGIGRLLRSLPEEPAEQESGDAAVEGAGDGAGDSSGDGAGAADGAG